MTIWYYVLKKKARGERSVTQDVVCFMDCNNIKYTILTVNRGLDDVYCLAVGDWRLEAARD